jgi:hypothetical protein
MDLGHLRGLGPLVIIVHLCNHFVFAESFPRLLAAHRSLSIISDLTKPQPVQRLVLP